VTAPICPQCEPENPAARYRDTCLIHGERSVWDEVQQERERAHAKHGKTSMEALPDTDLTRLTVLMEEVGEVAREFNEARHRAHQMGWATADAFGPAERASLRDELIQVAAMAGAWANALTATERPS